MAGRGVKLWELNVRVVSVCVFVYVHVLYAVLLVFAFLGNTPGLLAES